MSHWYGLIGPHEILCHSVGSIVGSRRPIIAGFQRPRLSYTSGFFVQQHICWAGHHLPNTDSFNKFIWGIKPCRIIGISPGGRKSPVGDVMTVVNVSKVDNHCHKLVKTSTRKENFWAQFFVVLIWGAKRAVLYKQETLFSVKNA